MCVLILEPTLESLHVCYFHKPHMDQPLESLHVCYFHKPHMDQPLESLHVCSFHKPHMDKPLESLHVCSYTKTSTRVIACVFFSQTTQGSTSGHCMFVLSTNHLWINQWSLHVCSFPQTTYGSTSGHCMSVLFANHMWSHYRNFMCVLILK